MVSILRILLSSLIIIAVLGSFSCNGIRTLDEPVKRILKPYNPEKAGAVIVDCFDITGSIIFPIAPLNVADFDRVRITAPYDIFILNDNFYIHIEGKIYIFDKNTFNKKQENTILFSALESDLNGNQINYNKREAVDPQNILFGSQGFIVIGNKALLLCNSKNAPLQSYLFLIDLNTFNVVLIEDEEDLDIKSEYKHHRLLGYDTINSLVWFRIADGEGTYFKYYQYDNYLNTFTVVKSKIAPGYVGKNNENYKWWANISGDIVWYSGYAGPDHSRRIWGVGIDKRYIDDPENSLHFIDVEYLGTLSIPQSIIYDDPYIWIMAERDGQIQMLRLLPNK